MANSISYTLAPDEVLLNCPYDKSHKILSAKFLVHLDKCQKNYRKKMGRAAKTVACPWNFQHQMLEPELEYHMTTCPDMMTGMSGAVPIPIPTPKPKHEQAGPSGSGRKIAANKKPVSGPAVVTGSGSLVPSGEDWESEARSDYKPCYDPKVKLKEGNIIYIPQGLTKSEKKAHRDRERRRLQDSLPRDSSSGGASSATGSSTGKPYIPVGAPGWKA